MKKIRAALRRHKAITLIIAWLLVSIFAGAVWWWLLLICLLLVFAWYRRV